MTKQTELDRFAAEAVKAVEELASLRDNRDPDAFDAALSRALILLGSVVLWLRTWGQDAIDAQE